MTKYIETFGFMGIDTEKMISNLEITTIAPTTAWKIAFIEDMPVMTVPLPNGKLGYLSPFRGYRFQVSATFKGSGDLGSTSVMTDMYRLVNLGELGAKIYAELCELAFCKAANTTYIPIEGIDMFDVFVALCYDYFKMHYNLLQKIYA